MKKQCTALLLAVMLFVLCAVPAMAAGSKTTLNYKDGSVYMGEVSGGRPNGKGTVVMASGSVYTGDFVNGQYQGKGTYISSDGNAYVGDFVNSNFHGYGTFTWADGTVYVGDFADNARTGRGMEIRPNGEFYLGEVFDGYYHGQGTYFAADGTPIDSGLFENHRFLGSSSAQPTAAPTPEPTAAPAAATREPYAATGPRVMQFRQPTRGSYVIFGAYEQDGDLSNGPEPIEWLVVDDDEDCIVLISRYVLDSQPYNTTRTKVTWETCTLRTWLNDEFLNSAFTAEEQAMIPVIPIAVAEGVSTHDKVFIPSHSEAQWNFGTNEQRGGAPTAYAVQSGARITDRTDFCLYWLRTTGAATAKRSFVNFSGEAVKNAGYVDETDTGVRPMIWVDLNLLPPSAFE